MASDDGRYRFTVGESILCTFGPLIYEVKCLKVREDSMSGEPQYYVHYKGWKKSHDEWVDDNRLLNVNAANMEKMTHLKNLHCKPVVKTNRKKQRRPLNKTTLNKTAGILNKKSRNQDSRITTLPLLKLNQANEKTRPAVIINRSHNQRSCTKQPIDRKKEEKVKVNQPSKTKSQSKKCFEPTKTKDHGIPKVVKGPIVYKGQRKESKTQNERLDSPSIVDDPIIDLTFDEEEVIANTARVGHTVDLTNDQKEYGIHPNPRGTNYLNIPNSHNMSGEKNLSIQHSTITKRKVIANTALVGHTVNLTNDQKEDEIHPNPRGTKYHLNVPNSQNRSGEKNLSIQHSTITKRKVIANTARVGHTVNLTNDQKEDEIHPNPRGTKYHLNVPNSQNRSGEKILSIQHSTITKRRVIANTARLGHTVNLPNDQKEDEIHPNPRGTKYYLNVPNSQNRSDDPCTSRGPRKRRKMTQDQRKASTAVNQGIFTSLYESVVLTTDEDEDSIEITKYSKNTKIRAPRHGFDLQFPASKNAKQKFMEPTVADCIVLSSDEE